MGEGEKRKEGFSPSPLSLFRFHFSPFPQKRLILRLPPTQKMLPTLGARSFAAAAPALWNKVSKVPADIRNVASFK